MAEKNRKARRNPFQQLHSVPTQEGSLARRTYSSWAAMLSRCHNPKAISYEKYGGSGILVCDRWRLGEDGKTGFDCFYEDMGLRPIGTSLDRREGKFGYFKANCRWSTVKVQLENRGVTQWVTVDGEAMCLGAAARHFGLDKGTVRQRWHKGFRGDALFLRPPERKSFKNTIFVINGVGHTVKEWSLISGIGYTVLLHRIKKGLVGEDMILPLQRKGRP